MGVAGDGQLAVCDDDHVRVHAAGPEAARDVALHREECDCILANVQVRALCAVPAARVRSEVDVDLVRAGGHCELPVRWRTDALAVAVEVVEAIGLARRRATASGEVHVCVAVAIPAEVHTAVAAGGEARAVVEDRIGSVAVAVVSAFGTVPEGARAGVRRRQGRAEVELRCHRGLAAAVEGRSFAGFEQRGADDAAAGVHAAGAVGHSLDGAGERAVAGADGGV